MLRPAVEPVAQRINEIPDGSRLLALHVHFGAERRNLLGLQLSPFAIAQHLGLQLVDVLTHF